LKLEIKAELEGVTDLKPSTDDFEYFFKVVCTSCHEVHPKLVTLNRIEELQVSGGRHGTANLIWRCSNCKHENSAKFEQAPLSPYTADHSGTFSSILTVECRGLEFTHFDPWGNWKCKSTDSTTVFSDFKFEDGEWFDYDEKAARPVQITSLESRFTRA